MTKKTKVEDRLQIIGGANVPWKTYYHVGVHLFRGALHCPLKSTESIVGIDALEKYAVPGRREIGEIFHDLLAYPAGAAGSTAII
jgi:hypothetical protein